MRGEKGKVMERCWARDLRKGYSCSNPRLGLVEMGVCGWRHLVVASVRLSVEGYRLMAPLRKGKQGKCNLVASWCSIERAPGAMLDDSYTPASLDSIGVVYKSMVLSRKPMLASCTHGAVDY